MPCHISRYVFTSFIVDMACKYSVFSTNKIMSTRNHCRMTKLDLGAINHGVTKTICTSSTSQYHSAMVLVLIFKQDNSSSYILLYNANRSTQNC